jgi:hypothetical protein
MAYMINRQAPKSGLANLLAMKGRMGDTELVHMTKPEVAALQTMGQLTINPSTGLPEAFKLKDILPTLAVIGGNIMTGGGLSALQAAMLAGGTSLVANKGDIGRAAMDGLMAFGGAKMAGMIGGAQIPGEEIVKEEVAKQTAQAAATSPIVGATAPTAAEVTTQLTKPSYFAQGIEALGGPTAQVTPVQQALAGVPTQLTTQQAAQVGAAQAATPLAATLAGTYDKPKMPEQPQRERLEVSRPRSESLEYIEDKPLTQERIERAFIERDGRPVDPLQFYRYNVNPAQFRIVGANQGGEIENAASTNGGGRFAGMVNDSGRGDGMSDNVAFKVKGGGNIDTALLSPDEYVVDAYTVSALGNGSSDAGARILDEFREEVRKKAFGKKKQPNQINGKKIAKSYA